MMQNSAYPAKNSVALPTPSFKPKPMPNATAVHTYKINELNEIAQDDDRIDRSQ